MAKHNFAFTKANYIIMIAGCVILILGFVLMASDSEPYGFGILGLTVGPITVILGLLTQFIAIFYRPNKALKDK